MGALPSFKSLGLMEAIPKNYCWLVVSDGTSLKYIRPSSFMLRVTGWGNSD